MKIGIGTVQFGINYGVSNKKGMPSLSEIKFILDMAYRNNINLLDTGSLYGKSEKNIGSFLKNNNEFKIVTKTPFFSNVQKKIISRYILDSFYNSCKKLNIKKLYGWLVHNPNDLIEEKGEIIWDELLNLKKKQFIKKIGVSVYNKSQLNRILKKFTIDIVQLPISIIDQRFISNGYLRKLKSKGIEIHSRSTFLQGALLMDVNEIPDRLIDIKPSLIKFNNLTKNKNISPLETCLNFINQIDEVDFVICGIQSRDQLSQLINIANSTKKLLTKSEIESCAFNFKNFENIYQLLR